MATSAAATDPLVTLALATRTRIASGNIRVPPYPAVVGRLQRATADDRTGTRDIAQIVAADPVLVAMVLARSGSVASGLAPATSLEAAIARVGGRDLVRLALAASLGSATAGVGPLAALRRGRWQDALLAAGLCELLADGRGVDPERAYLGGLLHDFGAIVVIACLEEQLAKQPLAPQPEEAWARIVERHHLDAAVHVADAWKLPADIAQVMAEHHDIGARSTERPLLHLVWDIDRTISSLTSSRPITGLDPSEAAAVTAALPTIVTHIAAFETAMPPVVATVKATTVIEKPRNSTDGWPVDFDVTAPGGARFRCKSVWADRFLLEGVEPLRPDWLSEITLADGTDRIDILVHVRACQVRPHGFAMMVQPFGLGGEQQIAWARIVDRAKQRG